ncbi:hypothetical protein RBU49_03350 [Clostridium sp. MB40-C1]|uniref:hypothetical protein n=1 Tax=Clostridium sp. MB40-C1 TaxID=3070996 RepID=UPI0027E1177D|nr:hypothetical protein [Clostridium sp. MB40-C1]WMJ81306.1 hypothetical protein RBU49_03350 [Clostridium sp. MB40-C1]
MEYRLNKIDTELRQIVNDATKEGKVHGNKGVAKVGKDKKEQSNNKNKQHKKKDEEEFERELKKYSNGKILVDAVKTNEVEVDAFKGKEAEDSLHGRFLDTKR